MTIANFPAAALSGETLAGAFAAAPFARAMLRFEAALARAQADEGVIPREAADDIACACAGLDFDFDAWVAKGRRAASLAVPLVDQLRATVGSSHRDHVHLGATSQDVLDTALAVCLKPCLEEADRVLEATIRSLVGRGREHRASAGGRPCRPTGRRGGCR